MANLLRILQNKPGYISLAAVTSERIQDAEVQLGVAFSEDYKDYVKALGAVAFEGHELTGISKSSRLSVVNVTLEEREANPELPSDWYVIEQLHIDDVSIWQSSSGEIYQVSPGATPIKIHDSLLEYIES